MLHEDVMFLNMVSILVRFPPFLRDKGKKLDYFVM